MVPRNKNKKTVLFKSLMLKGPLLWGFLVKPTIRSINFTVHSQVSLNASVVKHKEFYIKEYGRPTLHWMTRRIIYTL